MVNGALAPKSFSWLALTMLRLRMPMDVGHMRVAQLSRGLIGRAQETN
jgi:hypothetical protein